MELEVRLSAPLGHEESVGDKIPNVVAHLVSVQISSNNLTISFSLATLPPRGRSLNRSKMQGQSYIKFTY